MYWQGLWWVYHIYSSRSPNVVILLWLRSWWVPMILRDKRPGAGLLAESCTAGRSNGRILTKHSSWRSQLVHVKHHNSWEGGRKLQQERHSGIENLCIWTQVCLFQEHYGGWHCISLPTLKDVTHNSPPGWIYLIVTVVQGSASLAIPEKGPTRRTS